MTTHLVNTVTWNSRKLSSYSSRGQKSTVFIFLGLQGGLLLGASVQGLVRGAVGGVCFLPFRDSGGSPLSWAPGPFPPSSKPAMAESLSHCILWHSLSCLLLLHTEGSFIQRDIILGTARWCSSNIIAPIFKSSTQQPNSPLACNTVTGSGDYDIDIFGGWVKISSFFSFREKENAPPLPGTSKWAHSLLKEVPKSTRSFPSSSLLWPQHLSEHLTPTSQSKCVSWRVRDTSICRLLIMCQALS